MCRGDEQATKSVKLDGRKLVRPDGFVEWKNTLISYLYMALPEVSDQLILIHPTDDQAIDMPLHGYYLYNLMVQLPQQHADASAELRLPKDSPVKNRGALAWNNLCDRLYVWI